MVENNHKPGASLFSKQGSVASLLPFLTNREQYDLQLLNKRASAVLEFTIYFQKIITDDRVLWNKFLISKKEKEVIDKVDREIGQFDWNHEQDICSDKKTKWKYQKGKDQHGNTVI